MTAYAMSRQSLIEKINEIERAEEERWGPQGCFAVNAQQQKSLADRELKLLPRKRRRFHLLREVITVLIGLVLSLRRTR